MHLMALHEVEQMTHFLKRLALAGISKNSYCHIIDDLTSYDWTS